MAGLQRNNEDVPSTVAGFYYQVLLACREITKLIVDNAPVNTKVGIERGADIKIINDSNNNTSIEAKFYGVSFTKYSQPIYHTIFNFYKNSRTDKFLIFETNVSINDDPQEKIYFSRDWSNITSKEIPLYIRYVKICLIRESIEKEKKIKDQVITYCEENSIKRDDYLRAIEYIVDNINDISRFVVEDVVSDSEIEIFIRKFKFRSQIGDVTKLLSIEEIKSEINENIAFIKERMQLTTCEDCLSQLVDAFFLSTIEKTYTDKLVYNIKDEFDTISVGKVIDLLKKAHSGSLVLIEDAKIRDLITAIESREKQFYAEIDRKRMSISQIDMAQIKFNYAYIRKKLFLDIKNCGLQEFISYFTFEGHEENNTIINLLKYISILAFDQRHDIFNMCFGVCPIANVKFTEEVDYSYKYSNDGSLELFIYNFISDVTSKKQLDKISNNLPILMDYRNQACFEKKVNLEITSDIANVGVTENTLLQFSTLDYRCVKCFELQQLIEPERSFYQCGKIAIEYSSNE